MPRQLCKTQLAALSSGGSLLHSLLLSTRPACRAAILNIAAACATGGGALRLAQGFPTTLSTALSSPLLTHSLGPTLLGLLAIPQAGAHSDWRKASRKEVAMPDHGAALRQVAQFLEQARSSGLSLLMFHQGCH